jgi:hypothetical protein
MGKGEHVFVQSPAPLKPIGAVGIYPGAAGPLSLGAGRRVQ